MSLTESRDFSRLRTLLTETPSEQAFGAIIRHFYYWEHRDSLRLGIEYAEEHLETWPEHARGWNLEYTWPSFPEGEPKSFFSLYRKFSLTSFDMSDEVCSAIASSPHLAHLTYLVVRSSEDNPSGLRALLNAPSFSTIKTLILIVPLGDEGARILSESSMAPGLERLFLNQCQLTATSVGTLASSSQLANLQELHLNSNYFGDEGAKALANTSSLTQLQKLSLESCDILIEGAEALAGSQNLSNLTSLNLKYNRIQNHGALALADSPNMSNLTHLDLEENWIEDMGIVAIANSPFFNNLESLNLRYNEAGEEGRNALENSTTLTKLPSLTNLL